ncbi:hypothetical protein [Alteromonas sp. S005]|uniref:hypothetical protein n=1 Tax=Alteromonas sp. S005 TaxID=3117400 RepID=UPI002FE1F45D
MNSKRFPMHKLFFALLLSSKARILFSLLGLVVGAMLNYDPSIVSISYLELLAISTPFTLLGLFIGFLVDSYLNSSNSNTEKRDHNFQPEPTGGSGHSD